MLNDAIFDINTFEQFEETALRVFAFQFENNPVYRSFCDLLYKHPSDVKQLEDIPFLPISFFKSHQIITEDSSAKIIFTSSGTTSSTTSKHYVADLSIYEKSYRRAFEHFYGNIEDYIVLGLLPSYLERDGSSLIYMVNDMIEKSKDSRSGFYLHQLDELAELLVTLDAKASKKILLIGVSFALLDLIEKHRFSLKNTIIMETGGMKGRRKELIREELHDYLKKGFGVSSIHSEYGMTELLSQAYSKGEGVFKCPPWMHILIREPEDAFTFLKNKTGGINIVDLANIHSCSFIATQDLGKTSVDNTFEILGRFDHSDIRGCNLMVL
jgi:phenylacetate-coenzyme A ligase PaaK-like adenylate-forming protein